MKYPILSIAIPTFQRCEILMSTVNSMAEMCTKMDIPIVIIDNGSTDGTSNSIKKLQEIYNILRLQRFDINEGFLSSFQRVFECVDTEYVMVLSDEDTVDESALESVLSSLKRYDSCFFSTQVLKGNEIYRGKRKSGMIRPEDFQDSSFYISGLIYRNEISKFYMEIIVRDLGELPVTKLYPQSVLAACILANEDSRWIASPVTKGKEASSITTELGDPYFLLDSRVGQQMSWMKLIEWLRIETLASDKVRKRRIRQMEQGIVSRFFPTLVHATEQHSKEMGICLRVSAGRWVRKQVCAPKKVIRYVLERI